MRNWKSREKYKEDASPKRDSKIPERGRSSHQKAALPKISKRDSTEKEGRLKAAKFGSLGFTGSQWSFSGGAHGTSKSVCHSCKKSDYYAKRYPTSPQNLGRFLKYKNKDV